MFVYNVYNAIYILYSVFCTKVNFVRSKFVIFSFEKESVFFYCAFSIECKRCCTPTDKLRVLPESRYRSNCSNFLFQGADVVLNKSQKKEKKNPIFVRKKRSLWKCCLLDLFST